jgi:hypothetical protein
MAAAVVAATAVVAIVGTAGARADAPIVVLPALSDPGGLVKVSNGPAFPCPPPPGTAHPSASVDLYAPGSATPVNRVPFQGGVGTSGGWTVSVRLAPDLPPGTYRVQAGCYTDSGLNAAFGPTYAASALDVRLQDPGVPTTSVPTGRPGDSIQVGSADARCTPPAASPSPRVRVSLIDAATATRAEAEAPIDAATGRWSVDLRIPDLPPQSVTIGAVCLARVGAPAPYARYRAAAFGIQAGPGPEPSPTGPPGSAPPSSAAGPGARPTVTTPTGTAVPAGSLPPTPLAVPKVAEPTYTG